MPALARRALIVDADADRAAAFAARVRAELDLAPEIVSQGAAATTWIDHKRPVLVFVAVDAAPGQVKDSEGRRVVRDLFLVHPEAILVALVGPLHPEEAAALVHAGATDLLDAARTTAPLGKRLAHLLDGLGRATDDAARVARRVQRANEALAARRLGAAHAHARRALAIDPLSAAAFNVLGVVAQLRLALPDAQRLYRTALALDDRFAPARANLVNITGFPKRLSAFEV